VHFSSTSQTSAAARQGVADMASWSAGQAVFVPSHASTTSQSPAVGRHSVPAARVPHTPSLVEPSAALQARQSAGPPLHADSQQTESTQKPLWHCPAAEHAVPLASSESAKTYAEPDEVPKMESPSAPATMAGPSIATA
jgi:hypothetical protein